MYKHLFQFMFPPSDKIVIETKPRYGYTERLKQPLAAWPAWGTLLKQQWPVLSRVREQVEPPALLISNPT